MRRTVVLTALTLLFAFPAFSSNEQLWTMTPASGPATGGTKVTITGPFGDWPAYSVSFGGVSAASVTRVDAHTLEAVTPEHQPGVAQVLIFEYDTYLDPELTFEFTGQPAREQYLLPVLLPPLAGAFGSEFRTELRGLNTSADTNETISIWGLQTPCRPSPPICNWLEEPMLHLLPEPVGADLKDHAVFQDGTPGRFIEVERDQAQDLALALRVYDTSRSAENFGTAIPIVRRSELRQKPFGLLGVPLDARFRNTLRLYATGATNVHVQIGNESHTLALQGGGHVFDPSFAQWTAFPTGTGTVDVIVTPAENGPAVWGFISVTNNDTQHITTITPH